MIRIIVTYSLICSILATSLCLNGSVPQFYKSSDDKINFASYDKIPHSPYRHISIDDIPVSDLSLANVSIRALSYAYTPVGVLFRGAFDNFNSIVQYLQKIHRLNKLAKGFNLEKTIIILPYLGVEGVDLLQSYLRTYQPMDSLLDASKTKKVPKNQTKALNHLNQRVSGINPYLMRNLIDNFIQRFQQKALSLSSDSSNAQIVPAIGERYEEHIDSFIRELGLIVFSRETQNLANLYLGKDPHQFSFFLYRYLYEQGILTKSGGLLHQNRWHQRISDKMIIKALNKVNIKESSLISSILHDLGYVTPTDIEETVSVLKTTLPKIKDSLSQNFWQRLNERIDHIPKNLHVLEKDFYTYKRDSEVKETIELAILKTLVTPLEINLYKIEHVVPSNKTTIDDSITIYKLAYLEAYSKKYNDSNSYNYFTLTKDLDKIFDLIYNELDKKNICNENFQILSMREEDKIVASLTYVRGIGFFSTGILRIIPLLFATALSAAELSTILFLESGAMILTRVISVILHSIRLYHAVSGFLELKIKSHVLNLLQNYFLTLDPNKIDDEYKEELRYTLFSIHTMKFLKQQQKKLFLHQIGMESAWIGLNLASLAGIIATLSIFILGLTVTSALIIGQFTFGVSMVAALLALPFIYLVMREAKLTKDLHLFEIISDHLHAGLAPHQNLNTDQKDRKDNLLHIFMNHTKDYMYAAKHYIGLQDGLHRLVKKVHPDDMMHDLSYIFGHRRKGYERFIHLWENINHDENDKKGKEFLAKELDIPQKENEERLWWEHLKPSYHTTGIDEVMNRLDPRKNQRYPYSYILPSYTIDEYYQDIHLSNFFTQAYSIYNSVMKNMIEYSYVAHKNELQQKYFNVPVSMAEEQILHKRLKHRHDRIEDHYIFVALKEEQDNLMELHPDVNLEDCPLWNDQIMTELKSLIAFDKEILARPLESKNLPPLTLPAIPNIQQLVYLYLPILKPNKSTTTTTQTVK